MAPLAREITTYILDHQDDAAQEDRWRTTMKREMDKSFRKLETDMQAQREEIRKEVRGEIRRGVQGQREEMQGQREEMQGQREEMQGRFDDVLSRC